MKKATPYILLGLVAVALIGMFLTGSGKEKKLDERLSLRRKDKIPYGTWVAFQGLPSLFPRAAVYTTRSEPGDWDSVSVYDPRQAFISITPYFMPDEYEMNKLVSFARNGNDVFISTMQVSSEVEDKLKCSIYEFNGTYLFEDERGMVTGKYDSLVVKLKSPPFAAPLVYRYPGKNLDASFTRTDAATTDELGIGERGNANFIHLRVGEGNFYLHLAPMAFTNYFLLHKQNIQYYEKVMSVINPLTEKIVWDEYYIAKRYDRPRSKEKSWISVLFKYPALKAALLTAFFALLLYLLLGMRRKQRYIPRISRPRNDSLDFVKTIGRLYFEKSDHRNLCKKMATYFLEHVRSKYKIQTGALDDQFVKGLQYKSGVPEPEIREIVSFIKHIEEVPEVSPGEVAAFHQRLEAFYRKA